MIAPSSTADHRIPGRRHRRHPHPLRHLRARAIIAPGTGLGEALLPWDGERHLPFATEGGHTDFAPIDEQQIELWRFLRRSHRRPTWERVLSGPGIESIYRYLLARSHHAEPAWLAQEAGSGDPAAAISRRAMDGEDALCVETLELFFELLGAAAGNLALRTLCLGGLYLAGGILPKVRPALDDSGFLADGRQHII